jgi:dipeptidyl-peptidase-4
MMCRIGAIILRIAVCALAASPALSQDTARLARARAFSKDALIAMTRNASIVPNWIGGGERFWFKRQNATGSDFVVVDAATGKQISVSASPPVTGASRPGSTDVLSPDGRSAAFVRDRNVWLRDTASGQERQLTTDGVEGYEYGSVAYGDLMRVLRRRAGIPRTPEGLVWSPDSHYIATMRADSREVPLRPVVTEYAPKDSAFAIAHMDRYPVAADSKEPGRTISVIDARSGSSVSAAIVAANLQDYAPVYFTFGVVWWNLAGHELYFITGTRDATRYCLAALDLSSGKVRTVIEETERHYYSLNPDDYSRPNVYVTRNGSEAIWYSQRSGYGHLYLYDARSGKLKHPITKGSWAVFDIQHVDEAGRLVYFTAGGREKGLSPYYRHLYRVSLDGGEPQLLTPEEADHEFSNHYGLFLTLYGATHSQMSPSGRYFVDEYSTVDQPPVTVIRTASGRLVSRLVQADVSALHASGWRPPERFIVKADDGTTDLYGVMFRPADFDPGRRYAVIDRMYPGPQGSFAPQTFMDSLAVLGADMQGLAELGFVVIELDGRGTSRRSRDFRYTFAGTEDVLGAADHVAAIKHLAQERKWMDIGRVGVTGASFGGYGSLRATLLYPDFFKVCVSMVGPSDFRTMGLSLTNDRFFGYPARSKANADFEELITNTRLVGRLEGKLLLMYGGIDENVPLNQAFILFEALIKADKDFDTVMIPNSTHAVTQQPYAIRRMMEYFARQLGPPAP